MIRRKKWMKEKTIFLSVRFYQCKHLIFLVFPLLFLCCSETLTIGEEQAKDIVETSSHIRFKGKKIPFSVFHAHDGMYRWVVKLQRDFPYISKKTTIINIDMHSDAYGSRITGKYPGRLQEVKGDGCGQLDEVSAY